MSQIPFWTRFLGVPLVLLLSGAFALSRVKRGTLKLYLALLPTVFLLLCFNYYPAVKAFHTALYRYDIGGEATYIGLSNFKDILADRILHKSFANMIKLALFACAVSLVMPLIGAELIFHLKTERMRYFFRVLFVVPMVVPGIAVTLIWGNLYSDSGLVNRLLSAIGLSDWTRGWLSDPKTALVAVMFVGFPFVSGFPLLIYYAGLSNIPESLLDAAKIDGASAWATFRNIHLPMISGQFRVLAVLAIIGAAQGFESILILTRGGPGYTTMVPGYYMYENAFSFKKMGYACAIGLLLFLIMLAGTRFTLRFIRSTEEFTE
jgi:ABC-type sugar transport system permease subunit